MEEACRIALDAPVAASPETITPAAPVGPPSIFAVDTVLDGTYRIVKLLGQGGMGEVYMAAHERLPGFFAVKAMQPDHSNRVESIERFKREVEILAGVRHPNVVQVFDFNVSPQGAPYLVMELIDGENLDTELRSGRQLSPADVMSIVRQVASALDAAHAVGVVHRDLKPANIILVPAPGQAPVVKVIDFGISISEWSHRITMDNSVMGTPEYMSPEQALGRRDEIDARSDQFALAALAHTLLAQRPPFSGDSPLATLSAIVNGEPEELTPFVSWPAGEAQEVLRKGMARLRDDRFDSVLQLADALDAALERSGALIEPARACPSAAVAASASSPALALTLPAHRTSNSGKKLLAAAAPELVRNTSREETAASAAPLGAPVRPQRLSRAALSLAAILIVSGGVAATASSARPGEFQRSVVRASDALHRGWSSASTLLGHVPRLWGRLHL
jgi:serine/threonine protein kinase